MKQKPHKMSASNSQVSLETITDVNISKVFFKLAVLDNGSLKIEVWQHVWVSFTHWYYLETFWTRIKFFLFVFFFLKHH